MALMRKALLTAVASVLYASGWSAAKLRLAVFFVVAAVRVGYQEGRKPTSKSQS